MSIFGLKCANTLVKAQLYVFGLKCTNTLVEAQFYVWGGTNKFLQLESEQACWQRYIDLQFWNAAMQKLWRFPDKSYFSRKYCQSIFMHVFSFYNQFLINMTTSSKKDEIPDKSYFPRTCCQSILSLLGECVSFCKQPNQAEGVWVSIWTAAGNADSNHPAIAVTGSGFFIMWEQFSYRLHNVRRVNESINVDSVSAVHMVTIV